MTRYEVATFPELRRRYNRDWHSKNKDVFRGYRLKARYGISLANQAALFENQGKACGICRRTTPDPRWHTDHDHSTNKVRGVLCGRCNTGIGQMRDNPVILRLAAEYVELHRG